jgi:RNA polymerase sigma-70 factor (ECF subfamily)
MIRPTLAIASLAGVSDEELMEGLKNRNEIALQEFRVRFGRVLRTIVDDTLVEENEADDVVQDTFLQIWKRAHYYSRQCGKPLGWIITVARRRAIDRLRRRLSYSRALENFKAQAAEAMDSGTDRSFEEKLISSDLRRFLQSKLNCLPAKQREALELSFFDGLSHREIAVITGAPLGTVKTRLELGLRKMAKHVTPLRSKI